MSDIQRPATCHVCGEKTSYYPHDGFREGLLRDGTAVRFCRRHCDSEVGAKAIKRYEKDLYILHQNLMENLFKRGGVDG